MPCSRKRRDAVGQRLLVDDPVGEAELVLERIAVESVTVTTDMFPNDPDPRSVADCAGSSARRSPFADGTNNAATGRPMLCGRGERGLDRGGRDADLLGERHDHFAVAFETTAWRR